MATSKPFRPQFLPLQCAQDSSPYPPLASENTWLPLISCPADFPLEIFELAVSELIHHPEYNSTLILRSETVSDKVFDFPPSIPVFPELRPVRSIHRRLLPRRPGRDTGLEQYCTLYCHNLTDDAHPSVLVLTPVMHPGSSLPYYHPTVSHIAFRHIAADGPALRIEVVPLPNTPTDSNSRLYRTCLSLLETTHRYGWGAMTNFKKRVMHDCLIPREPYQDLYLVMRERHKHLVGKWQENTDPLKHVFEDIAIATYLMLLWKNTYDPRQPQAIVTGDGTPWSTWPRPPGGFLDLGCGNGLLTHILTAEGYNGHGIDLRARTSWEHYPDTTQAHLHVHAFDPTLSAPPPAEPDAYLKAGVFIIGNHADELTPWVPVLSTLYSASGYLSIPCCPWTFDQRYERSKSAMFPVPRPDFADTLNLGGDGSNSSSYSMYRIWLASLSLYCGWELECDSLRIPSTRNWAIVGRKGATGKNSEGMRHATEIMEKVREKGLFKTRKPEGKAGNH